MTNLILIVLVVLVAFKFLLWCLSNNGIVNPVLKKHIDNARIIVTPIKPDDIVAPMVEDYQCLQQIYKNGINAENKGIPYLQIKSDFTLIIYYDSLIGKYRYIPFDSHVSVDFVKKYIKNSLFTFLPLLFKTSYKNEIVFDIIHCSIPTFIADNGVEISTINIIESDLAALAHKIADELKFIKGNTELHINGLMHYSDKMAIERKQNSTKLPLWRKILW